METGALSGQPASPQEAGSSKQQSWERYEPEEMSGETLRPPRD